MGITAVIISQGKDKGNESNTVRWFSHHNHGSFHPNDVLFGIHLSTFT